MAAQASFVQRVGRAASVFARSVGIGARVAGVAFQGAEKKKGGMFHWRPRLASADREYLAERGDLVARQRDRARNDTAVASARRRRVSSAVGVGWRLSARINAEALGLSPEVAADLNRTIEREFDAYAYGHTFEADAQRQLTFGGLMRTIASTWFVDGECFVHLTWSPGEPASRWATRIDIIDTDRVSNPHNGQDTDTRRAGVELDPISKAPIGYHVRTRHPDDVGAVATMAEWRYIPRWTEWGRPQFLHVFDRERPGQTRGISQLTAALKSLKSLDRFGEATLENAILNALLLGAVKSNGGPAAVSESLSVEELQAFDDARSAVYDGRTVDLSEGVTLPVLPMGDELQLYTQARDVGSFEAFTRTILRRVAAALGVTYEELAMDYSTTNYSSARAAMIHAWAETQALQSLLRDLFVRPFYVAWLEEAIETGRVPLPIGAPDFWENLDAYVRARWIAPGKGYIDATKEIQATAMALENGLITQEDACAEQGLDWREVFEQRKRELEEMARLGLAPPAAGVTLAAAAAPQIVAAPDSNPAQPSAA